MNTDWRVTRAEVLEIMDPADTGALPADFTPFIRPAHYLVDARLTIGGKGVTGIHSLLDADLLKELEKWLAAHYACVAYPLAASESAGVSVSYETNGGG